MYSYLRGRLVKATPAALVLDVGGIGFRIEIPLSLFSKLPPLESSATLHVSFVVRELSHSLYGFGSEEERDLFEELIGLSGVGPKLALSLLGHMEPQELFRAVTTQDLDALARVPGIGKKKGERILVELKGKFTLPLQKGIGEALPLLQEGALVSDAIRALVHLGYPHPIASKAVQRALTLLPKEPTLSQLITESLRYTSGV